MKKPINKLPKKTKSKDLVKLNELTLLFEEFGRIYNDNFFLNNYKQQQIKNK